MGVVDLGAAGEAWNSRVSPCHARRRVKRSARALPAQGIISGGRTVYAPGSFIGLWWACFELSLRTSSSVGCSRSMSFTGTTQGRSALECSSSERRALLPWS